MRIETKRLILRKPVMEHALDIYNHYATDPAVTRYLIWKPHERIETTKEWLASCIEAWDEEKKLPFVIQLKEKASVIGMIEFNIHGYTASFGYVLAKAYWNQGIMTEAAKPLLNMIIKRDQVYRIEAVHDVDNPASGRVMQKVGMQFEGIVRKYSLHPNVSPIPRDCCMYSLVKG